MSLSRTRGAPAIFWLVTALVFAGAAAPAIAADEQAIATDEASDTAVLPVAGIAPDLPVSALVEDVPVRREKPSAAHATAVLAARDLAEGVLIIRFEVGRADDGGLLHITRLAQRALFEASRSVDAQTLQRRLADAGGRLELELGLHHNEIVLTAPADRFEALAREVLGLALAPRLHPRRFEAARQRTSFEILPPGSEIERRAAIAVVALGEGRYFGPGAGADRVVRSINLQEVNRHLRTRMAPANATVVAVGPFDPEAMARQLRRYRGGRPRGLEVRHLALPQDEVTKGPVELQLAAWPIDLGTPDEVAGARLLASILERRVASRLSAAGLGARIEVHLVSEPWLDFLLLTVPVAGLDAAAVKGHVRAVASGLGEDAPVDVEELEGARAALAVRLARAAQDPRRLARELLRTERTGLWYGRAVTAALENLDAAAVNDLAQRWIRRDAVIRVRFDPKAPRLDPAGKARSKGWAR